MKSEYGGGYVPVPDNTEKPGKYVEDKGMDNWLPQYKYEKAPKEETKNENPFKDIEFSNEQRNVMEKIAIDLRYIGHESKRLGVDVAQNNMASSLEAFSRIIDHSNSIAVETKNLPEEAATVINAKVDSWRKQTESLIPQFPALIEQGLQNDLRSSIVFPDSPKLAAYAAQKVTKIKELCEKIGVSTEVLDNNSKAQELLKEYPPEKYLGMFLKDAIESYENEDGEEMRLRWKARDVKRHYDEIKKRNFDIDEDTTLKIEPILEFLDNTEKKSMTKSA